MAERNSKDIALGAVRKAGAKRQEADKNLRNTMRLARDEGASLRDIGEAAGIPHTTVADWIRMPAETDA